MRVFRYSGRNIDPSYPVQLDLPEQTDTVDDEVSDEVLTHVGALRDALWRDTQGADE
jgi:hypothetical protein